MGVKFYDRDDTLLLEAGRTFKTVSGFITTELILEERQRLLGVKSRLFMDYFDDVKQFDFRFIIGWLE
jgi:hypothetical protein